MRRSAVSISSWNERDKALSSSRSRARRGSAGSTSSPVAAARASSTPASSKVSRAAATQYPSPPSPIPSCALAAASSRSGHRASMAGARSPGSTAPPGKTYAPPTHSELRFLRSMNTWTSGSSRTSMTVAASRSVTTGNADTRRIEPPHGVYRRSEAPLLGDSEVSAGASTEELASFVLVETAPDAVRLSDLERVLEARPLHRAGHADGLGLPLTCFALFFALARGRWKEHRGFRTAAGCTELPGLVGRLNAHGRPSSGLGPPPRANLLLGRPAHKSRVFAGQRTFRALCQRHASGTVGSPRVATWQ